MKKLICVILALVVMLGLTACGGSSKAAMGADGYSQNIAWEDAAAADVPMAMESMAPLASPASPASQALPDNRKWIITVDMDAETEDLDAILAAMDEKITQLGGYVEDQTVNNGSSYSDRRYRNARLTVRIPAQQVEDFTAHMEGISNVVSSNKSLEDITLNYVSTESRLKALQAEEERLLELMKLAEDMSDLLEIEGRLTDVRWELESVTSQLRTFDNQINFATIYLYINEVKEYTPVAEKTLWQRISGGFVDSLKGIGEGALELLVWLIVSLPYLLILGGVVFVIVLLIRKGKKKKAAKRQQQYQAYLKAQQAPSPETKE